jgi:acyl carrier protein
MRRNCGEGAKVEREMADSTLASAETVIIGVVNGVMARRGVAGPIDPAQDLTEVGLTSLDMVNLMLAIEDAFGIEIPQKQMTPANFRSIAAIERLVSAIALAA